MHSLRALPTNWPGTIGINEGHIPRFISAEQLENLSLPHRRGFNLSFTPARGAIISDASLFRRPNHFVHLNLETNRQGVRNNLFRQLVSGNGYWAGGDFFQGFILLLRREG